MRTAIAIPTTGDSTAIASVLRYLALEGGQPPQALETALRSGASQRVLTLLKSAIAPGTTSTWSQLAEVKPAVDGWFESLRPASAFFRLLLDGSLVRTPLKTRVTLATSAAAGGTASEADARVFTSVAFDSTDGLMPIECYAAVVTTQELLHVASAAAQSLLEREIKAAAAQSADSKFISILSAAATSITSSGSTLSAALADMKNMLGAVDIGSRSKLAWITSPAVTKALALGVGSDPAAFPNVGLMGGTLFGAPIIASSGVSDSDPVLYLIDGSGIAADADAISLQVVTHGDIQLVSSGADSPETTSTVPVSLWQRNMIALKASAFIGAEVFKSASVAKLTAIGWATSSPDSP